MKNLKKNLKDNKKKLGIALVIGCLLALGSFYSISVNDSGSDNEGMATFSLAPTAYASDFGAYTNIVSFEFIDNEANAYWFTENNESNKIALNTKFVELQLTVDIDNDYASSTTEAKDYTKAEIWITSPSGSSSGYTTTDSPVQHDSSSVSSMDGYYEVIYTWNISGYTVSEDGEYTISIDYDIFA